METNMTRSLMLALALVSLVGCAGGEDDNTSGGSAQDIASEGEFPPECGTPSARAGLNEFEYEVSDLDGCNDVQAYTFSFDWTDGPVLVVDTYEFDSGSFEVTLTGDDGIGSASYASGDTNLMLAPYSCED